MTDLLKERGFWHHKISTNSSTCYIDYNIEDFTVHVRFPLGKYDSNTVWLYPCIFNNKPVILIPADQGTMGYNHYGQWGIHYI